VCWFVCTATGGKIVRVHGGPDFAVKETEPHEVPTGLWTNSSQAAVLRPCPESSSVPFAGGQGWTEATSRWHRWLFQRLVVRWQEIGFCRPTALGYEWCQFASSVCQIMWMQKRVSSCIISVIEWLSKWKPVSRMLSWWHLKEMNSTWLGFGFVYLDWSSFQCSFILYFLISYSDMNTQNFYECTSRMQRKIQTSGDKSGHPLMSQLRKLMLLHAIH